ncbi:hypothetical protein KSX_71540 [Ktedonospora formicarum]|uniref:Uncharacterized protein n=1 Tax=Ktedonospora formicarum TaxID=2778364 RepID=A0A8J3I7P4_9CHLR|nr:hypothetical protein KSX_71540 [Ktedonospora formicarum]
MMRGTGGEKTPLCFQIGETNGVFTQRVIPPREKRGTCSALLLYSFSRSHMCVDVPVLEHGEVSASRRMIINFLGKRYPGSLSQGELQSDLKCQMSWLEIDFSYA